MQNHRKDGADVIVIRHPMSELLILRCARKYINYKCWRWHERAPYSSFIGLFTVRETKDTIEGLKVAIIGDIYHSRVARKNIWGLSKMGAKLR